MMLNVLTPLIRNVAYLLETYLAKAIRKEVKC